MSYKEQNKTNTVLTLPYNNLYMTVGKFLLKNSIIVQKAILTVAHCHNKQTRVLI